MVSNVNKGGREVRGYNLPPPWKLVSSRLIFLCARHKFDDVFYSKKCHVYFDAVTRARGDLQILFDIVSTLSRQSDTHRKFDHLKKISTPTG